MKRKSKSFYFRELIARTWKSLELAWGMCSWKWQLKAEKPGGYDTSCAGHNSTISSDLCTGNNVRPQPDHTVATSSAVGLSRFLCIHDNGGKQRSITTNHPSLHHLPELGIPSLPKREEPCSHEPEKLLSTIRRELS